MIRRLLPDSLAGRILAVIALALLVAQLVGLGLLVRERERQIFTQTSAPAIARLADALERDAAGIDPARRDNGRRDRRIRVTPDSLAARGPRPRPEVAERAAGLLAEAGFGTLRVDAGEGMWRSIFAPPDRQVAGPGSRGQGLRGRHPRHVLVISAETAPGRWISVIAAIPPRPPGMLGWLIVQTVILYVLVLLPVWWLVRRLARPLADLRAAAEGFRSPAPQPPLPESGPSDLRSLITAFNAMRLRLSGMLSEKDRMLGAIGHDLRTPLAALRVRVESLDDTPDRARMEATIDGMHRTLEDILALARIGRSGEATVMVDLGALVEAVLGDFEDLGNDVAFVPGDRITLVTRPNAIRRALRNLVENAIKYAAAAQVSLTRDNGAAVLAVADRGPGISPGTIERMFDPFTRLEGSRNRETGGAGLGLALARGLVEAEGGTLVLANREGGGLIATIRLPAG